MAIAPAKDEIQFLAFTLLSFGEDTGLITYYQKSSVLPINCGGVDLDDILQSFPTNRAVFPVKYLGLTLSVTHLKVVHFQHLKDKAASKLTLWPGKRVASAGRAILVEAVLTTIPINHMTLLEFPAEIWEYIDKLCCAYLWVGCDKVSRGKCNMNWE